MQVGNYAMSQRLGAYFWRGAQFFAVGFGSSMVGHTLTKTLVRPAPPHAHAPCHAPSSPLPCGYASGLGT